MAATCSSMPAVPGIACALPVANRSATGKPQSSISTYGLVGRIEVIRPAKSRPCQRWSRIVQAAQNSRPTPVFFSFTGSPVEPEVMTSPTGS